jgi:secondary thiamine-phosphate synthase enzyme
MKVSVKTTQQNQLVNVTPLVLSAVAQMGIKDGAVLIYVPHTTAGITINEAADPDVADDILMALNSIVPSDAPYRHAEGNSPAHVKASLMGSSAIVAVENASLVLGVWQGVFFCEFDGPRNRTLHIFSM